MKALLIKKWGGNYAGQVLTNVAKDSIPSDVAKFYEDDEPTPMDVVVDHDGSNPDDRLMVVNDEMNPAGADEVAKEKKDKVAKAAKVASGPGLAESAAEEDREAGQRRAREADQFAAKRAKGNKGKGLTAGQKKKSQAGKEHGVK